VGHEFEYFVGFYCGGLFYDNRIKLRSLLCGHERECGYCRFKFGGIVRRFVFGDGKRVEFECKFCVLWGCAVECAVIAVAYECVSAA